mmetsp:Transcript_21360/g.20509  ORF Transcript_21360/g.20509 Transcript_21360/m.20509 type:complete len:246 (-) Transcript_21360:436-1173(-)
MFCTLVANQGMSHSSNFNILFTLSKLSILLFIALVSFYLFDISYYANFVEDCGGLSGILKGSTLVYYSYLGFDIMSIVAEEGKNALKDVPKSMVHSILYVAIIYILISISIFGVGRLQDFEEETAMARVYEAKGLSWMALVICICAFFGITASDFTNILSQSRVFYMLARDGLMFPIFGELNPKTKVPAKGAWISCFFICLCSFFLNLETITRLIALGNLSNYCLVNMALISLRFRGEENQKKGI